MLAEALAIAKEKHKKMCVVGAWVHSLEDYEDCEAVENALQDPEFSSAELLSIFKNAGATFSKTSLVEHRAERCTCQK